MNILTIPLRNSRKKPARTLLLVLVFSLGVLSIVALDYVSREVGRSLEEKLVAFGANILLTPPVESMGVSYGGMNLGQVTVEVRHLSEQEVTQQIDGIENRMNLRAISPKLVTTTKTAGGTVGLVGVRFKQERSMKNHWSVSGAFPEKPDELLAGHAVASRLGLVPGNSTTIGGKRFLVRGILAPTGGDDDQVLFADLGALQTLFALPDKINFVEVAALCAGCPIEELVRQLREKLPDVDVRALKSIVKQRMASIEFVEQLAFWVSVVILISACTMVGLSMLSAVNERKKEVGLLRSLGFSRARVFGIFCFEALLLGLVSGVLGYGAGFALSFRVLDLLGVEGVAITFAPLHFAAICAAIAAVSVLSAFVPAWKASRIRPSEALVSL